MSSILEREIAINLVYELIELGLTENLAQYGEHGTENWFREHHIANYGYGASSGASKACFWHPDLCDWVIKVGYTERVKHNYATVEYNIYCAAEEAGLQCYFPRTEYLGEFDGQPFYIQHKADCDEFEVSSDWRERLRERYTRDGEEFDEEGLWDEVDYMDDYERIMLSFNDEELWNFLSERRIGDFHNGNFGYIGGQLVIVDFSGWNN